MRSSPSRTASRRDGWLFDMVDIDRYPEHVHALQEEGFDNLASAMRVQCCALLKHLTLSSLP
ncbi:uncharacterized protein MEPE_06800 [Melanopsichium pennsylvanicum]|uniref:Uncharacterized protein n=1 Tax=Melanopsichium pennsylvanicum TaxID=63383 RepID=A0AAJ4XRT2_9BASI|nr:uncharacterized protein MEPE_06800 [Melanopsichium pennsylvanicum]